MKLFGKKTLALILALSMVMSVCVFAGGTDSVEAGATKTLSVEGVDASALTWTSKNTDVATVKNGVVTGVKPGTAKITATRAAVEGSEGVEPVTGVNEEWTITVTEGTISEVKADKESITVPFGTTKDQAAAAVKAQVKLTATNDKSAQFEVTAGTWTCETWDGAVTKTNTFTTTYGEKPVSVTVTVVKAVVSENVSLTDVTVPLGIQGEKAMDQISKDVSVKLQDGSTKTLKIGTELEWEPEGFKTDVAGTYPITAKIKSEYADKYEIASGKSISVKIIVTDALKTGTLELKMVADEYDDTASGFKAKLKEKVEKTYGITISNDAEYKYDTDEGTAYGTISGGTYKMDLDSDDKAKLREDGKLVDTFECTVKDGDVTYTVPVELTIYYIIYNTGDDFDYKGGSLSAVATAISGRLNDIYGKGMHEIRFTSISDKGGDLYEDSTCEETVEEDYNYSLDEMKAMTYLPNGSGEYTEISYTAWTTSDSQKIYGEITLDANAFVLLTGEIGSGDTLDFDAEDILDAIYEADDEFEVNYVKFTTLPGSTKGYLYHEYDADKTSNTKVTTSKTYYVEPTGSQLELTNYTYVPSKTASGVVEIVFKAYKTSSKTITGVIRVNVIEEADITVAVGKGESTALDLDWFYDIVKEYASTSAKKKYEIAYIVFNNAPNAKSEGYLYVDGDKLTSPDGDKFYAYDSDDGDYDFDDLTFVGGNTAKTTHATFAVYGRPSNSTSRPVVLVSNRTIDFVVGSSHSINNAQSPMKAAEVMNFYKELDAFASLGDNDNVYVEFTSLPKGGKLYYNYGLPTQEDVTIGTEYYITSASNKKLLKNVTFVPSYSSDKVAKTISWGIKGYNKNGKSVTGTVDISVTYAYSSLYFSDISGSLYADSVDFLKNRGITTGVPGGKYDAAGKLSRAELVTFLYRAAGSPAVNGTSKFTDVPTTEYFYKAVLWATQNGITKGTNAAGTLFSPYAKVTNQEIIQFMYNYDVNYLKHTSYVAGSSSYVYDYNQVADWAQVAVKWAVGKSVLTPGLLNPTTVGIRGDIALYLHRMLTL